MDVEATLEELYRLERFGIKLGLDNIQRLLSLLGDPHRGLRAVHVTGTNGKGSVCALTASILRAAGYRVGLYTSPHLVRFNERIRIDGKPIADEDILRLWSGMQPALQSMIASGRVNHPTFFEVTTAMALQYFREREVDVAVVEVGMGGRMDATNVVDGDVAVITRVGLEHTEHLGRSAGRIAREKSGIIKAASRVVTVTQEALPVIEARCRELHVPLTVLGQDVLAARVSGDLEGQLIRVRGPFGDLEVHTPLLGAFQVENVGMAVTVATELREKGFRIPDESIAAGVSATRWPGRLDIVHRAPTVLVDGAHNGPAAEALTAALRALFPSQRFVLVVGILSDKDLGSMARSLGPLSRRIFATHPKSHRAFPAEDVARAFQAYGPVDVVPAVGEAVDRAIAGAQEDEIVLITGSIYTAGEALAHLGAGP